MNKLKFNSFNDEMEVFTAGVTFFVPQVYYRLS